MKRRLKLLGIVIGATALLVLTLGSTVFADTPGGVTGGAYCGGFGGHGFQGQVGCDSEAVSALLGLSSEEIHAQRLEGKSLAEIAAAQGVSEAELIDVIMAEKQAAVQARVDDGTLTQEQADYMLEQMGERTELAVNSTDTGPGLGSRWGAGSSRGFCSGDAGIGAGPGGMHRYGGMHR
ncbi:hypothetical protein ACFLXH_03375 [Chloroflexota bacterium]